METLLDFMDNYGSVIDLVYKVIMISIFVFGLYSILFQKKGLQYSTIKDCINIHRDILRNQQKLKIEENINAEEHKIFIKDHLGLVTDELFYMKKKYLGRNISKNWLRHMVDFIPIQCNDDIINEYEILNSKEISDFINLDKKDKGKDSKYYIYYTSLVKKKESFKKISKTFVIKESLYQDLESPLSPKNKQKLVECIWGNIKNGTQQKK